MAELIFNIPDDKVQEVMLRMSQYFGYRPLDNNGDANPETRGAYTKRKMRDEMISRVRKQEFRVQTDAIVIDDIDIT